MPTLPPYVVINDPSCPNKGVLRMQGETLSFPLSLEDRHVVETLSAKFDQEENCSGLAAPQIGFSKRVIVFAVPDDDNLRKWRKDIVETMPKTIWINPTYTAVGTEMATDYESCFSVEEIAGPVERFKTIAYTAYTPAGQFIEGTVNGFLARLIQHEVDHSNGILFIDKVEKDKLISVEEYRSMRKRALEAEQ